MVFFIRAQLFSKSAIGQSDTEAFAICSIALFSTAMQKRTATARGRVRRRLGTRAHDPAITSYVGGACFQGIALGQKYPTLVEVIDLFLNLFR